jgi:hypothetical protein
VTSPQHSLFSMKHVCLVASVTLLTAGCSTDVERALSSPPGPPTFATEISTDGLGTVATDHLDMDGQPARVRCATCHDLVDTKERAESPLDLKEFHNGLTFSHGTLACNSCHSEQRPDVLRLANGDTLETTDALSLCSQCHGPQRRSYDHGAHGGMNGHWDLSRGPRVRNHCVDCHNPHVPQIQPVIPAPGPRDRGQLPAHNPKDSKR